LDEPAELARLIQTCIANVVLALPVYLVCPAVGPKYAFASFPHLPHQVALAAEAFIRPPNCVPSVHCSTAFLIVAFLWRWPLGRILGLVYAAGVVLSTLGAGEHYLFDVLMAVPYTLIVLRAGRLRLVVAPAARPALQPAGE
jgi:membrane-associated phospholipid phosphatase